MRGTKAGHLARSFFNDDYFTSSLNNRSLPAASPSQPPYPNLAFHMTRSSRSLRLAITSRQPCHETGSSAPLSAEPTGSSSRRRVPGPTVSATCHNGSAPQRKPALQSIICTSLSYLVGCSALNAEESQTRPNHSLLHAFPTTTCSPTVAEQTKRTGHGSAPASRLPLGPRSPQHD